MLEHGGGVLAAAKRYGIPVSDWLDLSTGLNPHGWCVPVMPQAVWQGLPQDDDELHAAAQDYYGTAALLAVAGSQAVIQALPALFAPTQVALVAPSYAEHAHAWRQHCVQEVSVETILQVDESVKVVIIVNPNNPTGKLFSRDELLGLHAKMASRGGCLIVDEAFMDNTPEHSLAQTCPYEGLIVLRSIGKFFGLAGARVGFVLAEQRILQSLREKLGPWPIATPARYVARLALQDTAWQQEARSLLLAAQQRLLVLLKRYGLSASGTVALFVWVCCDDAVVIHQQLAQQGILTRLFHHPPSLRFGLPPDEMGWMRLEQTLKRMMQ